jgi:hypothetical protein
VTDTAPVATGLDTAEAASLISDLITDDLAVGDQTAVPQAHQTDDDEVRTQQGAGEDDNSSEETRSQDDEGDDADKSKDGEEDEKSTQDDEEDENAPPALPKTATVKIDGKEVEVPFEEVIAGYQRQADYTRKTQALAQEAQAFAEVRAQFEPERQAVAQERGQYKVLLTQLQSALDQLYPKEPDWAELYARDKNEFLLARDNWREYQAQKAAAAAELERVQSLELGEKQKAIQAHVQQGRAKLLEWEPKWQDEKVLREDFTATMDYAKRVLGYSDDELKQANDHRALYAVHKARLYDDLMAKAREVKAAAQKAPASKKVLPAGSANRTADTKQVRSKQDGMKRLVKGGGRVEDAAGLLANMMDL